MSAAPAAKRARATALDAAVSTLEVPGLGVPWGMFVMADGNCLVTTEQRVQLLTPAGRLAISRGARTKMRALKTARAPMRASTHLAA